MSENALYTDLSKYYDLMCLDINYQAQSDCVRRLHQIFGNQGTTHLDLACGTGPHIRHFLDWGFTSKGLDLNQPMLDQAQLRCPEASFSCQNMCDFTVESPVDLITCFLYSIHYTGQINALSACFEGVVKALNSDGVFCFNAVDKRHIDNNLSTAHSASQGESQFDFRSGWYYEGHGEKQTLRLSIQKHTNGITEYWQDTHPMVAVSFDELATRLEKWFDVHIFEHDYERLIPWQGQSGNAIFVCVKKAA